VRLPAGQTGVSVWSNSVDERYFETLGIPILQGRAFQRDDGLKTARVAIVNETLAHHYWSAGAIGRRFQLMDAGGGWIEIVGVAKDSAIAFPGELPQE